MHRLRSDVKRCSGEREPRGEKMAHEGGLPQGCQVDLKKCDRLVEALEAHAFSLHEMYYGLMTTLNHKILLGMFRLFDSSTYIFH